MNVQPITNSPVNFKNNDKNKTQTAVAATGITAGAAATVGKNGMRANALGKSVSTAIKTTGDAVREINKNSSFFEKIAQSFKTNYANCSKFITTKIEAFKNVKYIAPIIKSPIMQKGVAACSGIFAFFIAISSITNAINDGDIALDGIKNILNN